MKKYTHTYILAFTNTSSPINPAESIESHYQGLYLTQSFIINRYTAFCMALNLHIFCSASWHFLYVLDL